MRKPAYRAVSAYLDTDGEPMQDGVRGFIHPGHRRGDHAVILLADTPEIRRLLASVGIYVQPTEQEVAA